MHRLLALALGLLIGGEPAAAELLVELECRLDGQPWRRCTMQVERLGEHWWITTDHQRIEFRHDGRGRITMRRSPRGGWRLVSPRWSADAALCWNGVCLRGDIPLD